MNIIQTTPIILTEIGDWLIHGVDYLIVTRQLMTFVDALYRERVCPQICSNKNT